jgi:hypothetical protein
VAASQSFVHRQNVARADTLRFFWVLAPLHAHSATRVNEPQRIWFERLGFPDVWIGGAATWGEEVNDDECGREI